MTLTEQIAGLEQALNAPHAREYIEGVHLVISAHQTAELDDVLNWALSSLRSLERLEQALMAFEAAMERHDIDIEPWFAEVKSVLREIR